MAAFLLQCYDMHNPPSAPYQSENLAALGKLKGEMFVFEVLLQHITRLQHLTEGGNSINTALSVYLALYSKQF